MTDELEYSNKSLASAQASSETSKKMTSERIDSLTASLTELKSDKAQLEHQLVLQQANFEQASMESQSRLTEAQRMVKSKIKLIILQNNFK